MEKYVLITGASSGLGKATAQALAQKGFKVFAGIRKPQDKELLEQLHSGIIPVFIDVTNDDSVNCAFEKIKSMTDNLFALVNNAGIALAGPVEYIPVDILKKQFEVNVFGAIRTAQKALPLMKNLEDCRIVNISSMASYGIFPFISPYCVSKRALDMFFNSLILESKNPAFKSLGMSMLGMSSSIMQWIEAKGYLVSFLIQDGLGMTAPRVWTGFHRDKEITGEYNIQEGFEVLGREGITGPYIIAVAPAVLALTGKFCKSTNTNTRLIKRLGENFKSMISIFGVY